MPPINDVTSSSTDYRVNPLGQSFPIITVSLLLAIVSICGCCSKSKKTAQVQEENKAEVVEKTGVSKVGEATATSNAIDPTVKSSRFESSGIAADIVEPEGKLATGASVQTAPPSSIITTSSSEAPGTSRWSDWKYRQPNERRRPIFPFIKSIFDKFEPESDSEAKSWTVATKTDSVTASANERSKSKGSPRNLRPKAPERKKIVFRNKDSPEVLEQDNKNTPA